LHFLPPGQKRGADSTHFAAFLQTPDRSALSHEVLRHHLVRALCHCPGLVVNARLRNPFRRGEGGVRREEAGEGVKVREDAVHAVDARPRALQMQRAGAKRMCVVEAVVGDASVRDLIDVPRQEVARVVRLDVVKRGQAVHEYEALFLRHSGFAVFNHFDPQGLFLCSGGERGHDETVTVHGETAGRTVAHESNGHLPAACVQADDTDTPRGVVFRLIS